MKKQAPRPGTLIALSAFALSVVSVALFLWLSFGGSSPLKPRDYQVQVRFQKAFALPESAVVRQAGVDIGRVSKLRQTRNGTLATLSIQSRFAPVHRDARAILRTKSTAGETFVALSPGTRNQPLLPDGGRLADRNVGRTQTIEDVLQIFDAPTRRRFRTWQQSTARAFRGRGYDVNASLAQLPELTDNATSALEVLDRDRESLGRLTRDGTTVFRALSADQDALRQTVTSFDRVFTGTADEQESLRRTFARFPGFLRTSRATLDDLTAFSREADPVVVALRPGLEDLPPALRDVRLLSPDLRRLFRDLGPVYTSARRGLPATSSVLNGTRPLLGSLGGFLAQLNPVLQWLELNQASTSDFFSNGISALGSRAPVANSPNSVGHYLRQFDPGGAEAFAVHPQRLPTNRGNAYPSPLDIGKVWQQSGIQRSFDCRNAGGAKPETADSPACLVTPRKLFKGKPQGQFPHVEADDYRRP